jgi:hypothetical protein
MEVSGEPGPDLARRCRMFGFGVIAFFDYGLPLCLGTAECPGHFRHGFENGRELLFRQFTKARRRKRGNLHRARATSQNADFAEVVPGPRRPISVPALPPSKATERTPLPTMNSDCNTVPPWSNVSPCSCKRGRNFAAMADRSACDNGRKNWTRSSTRSDRVRDAAAGASTGRQRSFEGEARPIPSAARWR